MRCSSLYHAFRECGQPAEIVLNADDFAAPFLKGLNIRHQNWLALPEAQLKPLLTRSAAVVVDSYNLTPEHLSRMLRHTEQLFVVDDTVQLPYPPQVYVINPAPGSAHLDYGQVPHERRLLGGKYAMLRPAFWKATPWPQVRRPETCERSILLTFGGNDFRQLLLRLLPPLLQHFPETRLRAIVSKQAPHYPQLAALAQAEPRLTLLHNLSPEEMIQEMQQTHLAISAGGQTLMELAALQVPTGVIQTADNQRYITAPLHKLGWLRFAHQHNESLLADTICKHLSNSSLTDQRPAPPVYARGALALAEAIQQHTRLQKS